MSPALAATARWIERMVIGEGLCPFARAPWQRDQVRLVESTARDEQTLVDDLAVEVLALLDRDAGETATTVLVHPHVLNTFADYNDFLAIADEVLLRLGAEGVLQIASFHPHYRFEDAAADDAANYTNRSPHPMLHLLREADVTRAVDGARDTADIPARNVAHLRGIGSEPLRARLETLSAPE